jgi:hypothetical protein
MNVNITPDEQALLNNIFALLQELQSALGNSGLDSQLGQTVSEAPDISQGATDVEMECTPNKKLNPNEEVKKKKEIVESSSDGTTANDKTEDKIEDMNTNITNESIAEVAKMLLHFINKKKNSNTVNKSVLTSNTTSMSELHEIKKSIQAIAEKQKVVDQTLSSILDGIGVGKELESLQSQTVEKSTRKNINSNSEITELLNYIKSNVKNESDEMAVNKSYMGNRQQVNKSIKSIMSSVFTK